ncbi:hypothetical protein CsSME_00026860 [Camellia sinensis var. sinensis]
MGNVSGRKDEEAGCSSGTKHEEGEEEEEEEYMMEYAHGGGGARVSYHAHGPFPESMVQSPPHSPRAYHSPLMFTPQVPVNPVQRPDEMMQIQSNASNQNATQNYDLLSETLIPTMIMWRYHGKEISYKKQTMTSRLSKCSHQVFTTCGLLLMDNGGILQTCHKSAMIWGIFLMFWIYRRF